VAGDDLLDLALERQLDGAAPAVAAVVLVDREIPHVHRLEVVDQCEGVTLADESADGDAHAAGDVRHRLLDRYDLVLGHLALLCTGGKPGGRGSDVGERQLAALPGTRF